MEEAFNYVNVHGRSQFWPDVTCLSAFGGHWKHYTVYCTIKLLQYCTKLHYKSKNLLMASKKTQTGHIWSELAPRPKMFIVKCLLYTDCKLFC